MRIDKVFAALALAALGTGTIGSGTAAAAEIRTVGERYDDDVVAIGPVGGRAAVTTAKGRVIPLDSVKEIRFDARTPSRPRDAHLFLANGDELFGTVGASVKKGESVKLETAALGTLDVGLDALAGIFFSVSPEKERRLVAKRLGWLSGKGVRPQKDVVTLTAAGATPPARLLSFSKDGIELEGWPTFPLARVESLVLGGAGPRPEGAPPETLLVRVRCSDGSVLTGTVAKLEDGKLSLVHPLGALAIDMRDVLGLLVLNGAFTYLSDLVPTAVDERFAEGFERDPDLYAWKRDRAVVDGGPLTLGGRTYERGLGVHSYCSLTFPLGGRYRELRVTIGLDDATRHSAHAASVTFRVLVDGKVAREVTKSRGDAPEEINVVVEGAKALTLVADHGHYLHILGRADWADAHLVK